MKYDFFISSRWRNRDKVLELVSKIRETGKTVYCFFEAPDGVERVNNEPHQDMEQFEQRDWRTDPCVRDIFQYDMQAERESECLIMLLPAGKSAHIEAGVAYGMGKKCILIGEQQEAESLYLIFSEHYPTIDSFIGHLKQG